MKVYLIWYHVWNCEYDCEFSRSDDNLIRIKSTKEAAMNFVKNYDITEDPEMNDNCKWGVISDEFSANGNEREIHVGQLEEIYAEDGDTVIGYEELFIDGKRNYYDELEITLSIEEFDVEES